jgi:hypothetical protein
MIKKFFKRKRKINRKLFGRFRLKARRPLQKKIILGSLFQFSKITSKSLIFPPIVEQYRLREVKVPLHSELLNYVQEHNLTKILSHMDAPYH